MNTDDLVRRLRPKTGDLDAILERQRSTLMSEIETPAVTSPPAGIPQVMPLLPYDDIAAAVGWLESAFGFSEVVEARTDTPGGVVHAELEVGNGRIMLGTSGGHGAQPPRRTGQTSLMLCVYVSDVDAHYAQAQEAGAEIAAPIADKFYGDRVYEALDLEGHRWSFHQYTGRRFAFGPEDENDPEG